MIPKKQATLIIEGLVAISALFIFDIVFLNDFYLALIGTVIVIVLMMSVIIMRDTRFLPDVTAQLTEDAKSIIVVNRGSATAYKIHVSIVPLNIEFDAPDLKADASHIHVLGTMISEAKGVVAFENSSGQKYTTTTHLSALDNGEEDILKPLFPLFKWK